MQKIPTMNALQQGMIYGTLLGIVALITDLISFSPLGATNIFFSIRLTAILVFFVFIGMRASQVTGEAGTGALVGFLTGIFSAIIISIILIISPWTDGSEKQELANQFHFSGNAAHFLLIFMLFMLILIVFIVLPGLGALAGAIGGAIGKRQAKNEGISVH